MCFETFVIPASGPRGDFYRIEWSDSPVPSPPATRPTSSQCQKGRWNCTLNIFSTIPQYEETYETGAWVPATSVKRIIWYQVRYGMVSIWFGMVCYQSGMVRYGMVWYKSGVERGQSEYRLFITSPRPRIVIELLSAMPLVLLLLHQQKVETGIVEVQG